MYNPTLEIINLTKEQDNGQSKRTNGGETISS